MARPLETLPLTQSLLMRTDPEVFLVSGHHQGLDSTLVATWVLPVTLRADRGRVLVALSPRSLTSELVRASRRFTVQLLSEGQQPLIPHFGLVSGRETDKLDTVEIARTTRGLAVVIGTCGWLECDVIAEMVTDERIVLLGRVVEQRVFPKRRPLRLSEAYRALPQDVLRAIEEQRQRDGERDRP
jgi:flavin reductase (DIM6/NTAB) family NADH-FMN oxidoreductase RutF